MYISKIDIKNFRCLRDFSIELKPGLNLLLGENNSGKSAFLIAIDKILGRNPGRFELSDFYAESDNADPRTSPPIIIDIEIRPDSSIGSINQLPSFSENFNREFTGYIDFDNRGQPFLKIRLKAQYDSTTQQVKPDYFSLNAAGSEKPLSNRGRFILRTFIPYYLIDAFRDSEKQLSQRGSFWGRLLEAIPVDPILSQRISQGLSSINTDIVSNTPRLQQIQHLFQDLGKIIGLADPPDNVHISPIAPEPQDLLKNLEVLLRPRGTLKAFPLNRHGEGLRSLAVLTIFRIFVETLVREENENDEAIPVLAVEEPEAHLHPHSQRAIASEIANLASQVFISTHSPQIASKVSPEQMFLFRRPSTKTVLSFLPHDPAKLNLDNNTKAKLNRYLDAGGAEIFFSRCVILFEGPSEKMALPVFAKALNINLDIEGITMIPVNGKDYEPYLRLLAPHAFNIPWVLISDADDNAIDDIAKKLINSGYAANADYDRVKKINRLREDLLIPHNCFAYGDGEDFEYMLLNNGAIIEYKKAIQNYDSATAIDDFCTKSSKWPSNYPNGSEIDKIHCYLNHKRGVSKPFYARVVAEALTQNGTDPSRIPQIIIDALQRAKELANRGQ